MPPLVEIPLIGNILGVPLPVADLAFGLAFSPDSAPVYAFHNKMVDCLATGRPCRGIRFSDLPSEP